MTKPVIAIDVDDVLADNAAGFVAFSNERWGTNLKSEDYDEDWMTMWGISLEEAVKRRDVLFASDTQRQYGHNQDALHVLRNLAKRYDLRIVTSRHIATRDDTRAWIHERYPGVFSDETIHFAGLWDNPDHTSLIKTKAGMVASLGADYLIDDQLKHCIGVADSGRTALLFGDYRWNQTDGKLPDNIIRVKDWASVERYFDEF